MQVIIHVALLQVYKAPYHKALLHKNKSKQFGLTMTLKYHYSTIICVLNSSLQDYGINNSVLCLLYISYNCLQVKNIAMFIIGVGVYNAQNTGIIRI